MTTNAATATDYELRTKTTEDEPQQEQNNEKIEENNQPQKQEEEIIQKPSTPSINIDENVPEEDVLVEENITPFYMNTGENLQQTLHRLGIDLPENFLNEQHLSD
jgi:hypothetical protein